MKKQKFKKKYLTGVQAIEVPQADFPQSGDFLKQGLANAAASGNPLNAGVSLLTGGVGEIVNQATMAKREKLLGLRRSNAVAQNAALATNQGMDVNAATQYNRLNQGTEFIAEDGLVAPHESLIEVEKNELVFRRKDNKVKLIADFQAGKRHDQGGEDYVAQEGDIVIPKTKRKLVQKMMDKNSGFIIDKTRFENVVNKLPKDKDKAMLGTIVGTGLNLGGSLLSTISQAADLGEGRSHRIANQLQPIGDTIAGVGQVVSGLDGLIDPTADPNIDPNMQQQKFKKGGEVEKTSPLLADGKNTYTKQSVFKLPARIRDYYLAKAQEVKEEEYKPTKYIKKTGAKGSPLIYATGGTVGRDGQIIPNNIPTTEDQLIAGEQQYANYNNPMFSDLSFDGPRAVPIQPQVFRTPMSQDLPRKFGRTIPTPIVDSTGSNVQSGVIQPKFRTEKFVTTNKGQGLANTAGVDDTLSTSNSPSSLKDTSLEINNTLNNPQSAQRKKLKFNSSAAIDGAMNLASAFITDEKAVPEVRNSNLLSADHLTAIDTGDPSRQTALMNKEGAKRFRRNAGGGNINQVVSGMSADDQTYLGQVNQINAQQADKFQQVNNQNTQMDNTINQYNTERRNADIDINDANRAQARNIKRSSRSNYADAVQQTKVDMNVRQKDANMEAENIRANALKAGVAKDQHEEVMRAIETKRQYDQGSLELMGKANPQADANLRQTLIDNFGLTDKQIDVYLGVGLSSAQKRKFKYTNGK